MSFLRDGALRSADVGLFVLPLKPNAKAPIVRLVPNGAKNATRDRRLIKRWWEEEPQANIGARVGAGRVVLDVDKRHGGLETLRQLVAEFGPLPETPTGATGDDGLHYWFQAPAIHRTIKIGRGLELRASRNQYVVLPPSIHPNGKEYAWLFPFDARSLAPLPEWVPQPAPKPDPSQEPRALEANDFLRTLSPRRYVGELAGIDVGTKAKIRCPLPDHDDPEPSFHVYPTAEKGWYCFGCKRGGDIYSLAGLLAGYALPLRGADFLTVEATLLSFYETRVLR